jgi:beta-galactosidase
MKRLNLLLLSFLLLLAFPVFSGSNKAPQSGTKTPDEVKVFPTMVLGTVYNYFQEEYASDEEFFKQVDHDIPLMKSCNIKYVMINPMFEWDVDKKQRKWERTDYLIKKLEENDMKWVPEMYGQQGSDFFPAWKFREEGMNDRGNAGSHDVDFASPKIYPLVDEYFKEVVQRYGKSPALGFYNIWNEPHYSSTAPYIVDRYREWVKNKYKTLPALRRSWALEISSWEDVSPALRDDWKSSMATIDWTTFRSELNSVLIGELIQTLRKYDPDPNHLITANPVGTALTMMGEFGGYILDNWAVAEKNDVHGISYYPDIWERGNNLEPCPYWFQNLTFNTIRSEAGKKDFILTEVFTYTRNGLALNGYLTKDQIKLIAWSSIANGCKGMLYWQWRPFNRGLQSLGRGLTQVNGDLATRAEAVKELGDVFKQNGEIIHAAHLKKPQAAILIDYIGLQKSLAQNTERATTKFMYESNAGLFKALYEGGINADILRMDRPLDLQTLQGYKILYLPFQIVMRSEVADILKKYIEGGGCVVADARTATVDELDFAYRISPGAGLDQVFGADRIDWTGAKDYFPVTMKSGNNPALTFQGRYFREKLRLHNNAKVLGTFANSNEPAVIENRFGKGRAILSAVPLGASYWGKPENQVNKLLVNFAHEAGVTPDAKFVSADGSFLNLKVHTVDNKLVVYAINDEDKAKSGTLEIPSANTVKQVKELISGKTYTFGQKNGAVTIPLKTGKKEVMVFEIQ